MKNFLKACLLLSFAGLAIILTSNLNLLLPLIGSLSIGAVIQNGILGGGKNKVGPVIMSKWKSIDYIRAYAAPANPNTTAQQAVRSKFAQLVLNARQLLTTILKPFWDPFYSDKSGFNAFISANYSTLNASNQFQLTSKITQGTLEGTSVITAVYNISTGVITVDYDANTSGNGLPTDMIWAVVYDKASKNFVAASALDERSAVSSAINAPLGLTASNLILYLFATRGTGSSLLVSDSSSSNVS